MLVLPKKSLKWQDWFTCSPIALIAGVLAYFMLPEEPSLWIGVILLAFAALLYALRDDRFKLQMAGFAILGCVGFWLAALHTATISTNFLDKQYRYVPITGTVAEVIDGDGKYKLILEDVVSETIKRDAPMRVRISLRRNNIAFQAGDVIETKATLFPPSRPALPNAFDFTRYFYYQNIDAVGYVTGNIEVASDAPRKKQTSYMSEVRGNIAGYIKEHTPQPAAGIIIALATGQKDAITNNMRDALTASSLGHMLAISGMHMGIVCGAVFMLIRFLAACMPSLALQYPVKKVAALAGLLCGAAYLALADFPISAIRAYAMIAVIFTAIMFDRQADTLRCVVLAALGIVLINPQAVAEIGFQLSFVATLALILVYRRVRKFNIVHEMQQKHIMLRFSLYFVQLALSSFVAGLITAPLVAYHFNHVALYGILANMLALPVLSFLVAPALLLSVIIYPFGLAPALLGIAEHGVGWIVASAEYVANLPHATQYVPPFSPIVAVALTIALIALLSATQMKRAIVSMCIAAICILIISQSQIKADMLIAEDGSAIAVKQNDTWILLKGTPRNFHASMWEQMLGVNMTRNKDVWLCDDAGCDGMVKGNNVRVRFDYKVKEPLCLDNTDIVISTFYSNRWNCDAEDATRIDRDALERYGAHVVIIDENISVWNACQDAPKRLWKRCDS